MLLRSHSKKQRPLIKFSKLRFFQTFFGKLENISKLNFTFFRNMEKDTSHLKISSETDHPLRVRTIILLFHFTGFRKGNHKVTLFETSLKSRFLCLLVFEN